MATTLVTWFSCLHLYWLAYNRSPLYTIEISYVYVVFSFMTCFCVISNKMLFIFTKICIKKSENKFKAVVSPFQPHLMYLWFQKYAVSKPATSISLTHYVNNISLSLTISLYHYLTISLSHYLTISPYHYLTTSLYHSLTISLYHSLTISLSHYITLSLYHSLTISLYHYITISPCHYVTLTLYHSLTISLYHNLTISLYHYLTQSNNFRTSI